MRRASFRRDQRRGWSSPSRLPIHVEGDHPEGVGVACRVRPHGGFPLDTHGGEDEKNRGRRFQSAEHGNPARWGGNRIHPGGPEQGNALLATSGRGTRATPSGTPIDFGFCSVSEGTLRPPFQEDHVPGEPSPPSPLSTSSQEVEALLQEAIEGPQSVVSYFTDHGPSPSPGTMGREGVTVSHARERDGLARSTSNMSTREWRPPCLIRERSGPHRTGRRLALHPDKGGRMVAHPEQLQEAVPDLIRPTGKA